MEAHAHRPTNGVCFRVCRDRLGFGLCARPRQVPVRLQRQRKLDPHDLVVLSEPSKNRLVDTLPNAGYHPFVKATPACHATTAAEFGRQVLPRYSSLENKQDSGQRRAIIDARAAAFRRWAMGRKMSCY